jgi:hypothetical protein
MMVPFSHFRALKRSTLIFVDATEKDKNNLYGSIDIPNDWTHQPDQP